MNSSSHISIVQYCLLTSLFWLLLPTHVWAAEQVFAPAPQAKAINVLDGLDLGNVNTITQSRLGFIWLGTDKGLVRYDGYNAKRFVNIPGLRHSLSHNKVTDIIEDGQDYLWVATLGGGLNRFNPQTERFDKIDLPTLPGDRAASQRINTLVLDADNILWIGSDNGLNRFDIRSKQALGSPQNLAELTNKKISQVFIDSNKHLWVTTIMHGVYWQNNNKLYHFSADQNPQTGLGSNTIYRVTEDQQGTIWLGTEQGLHLFDSTQQQFEQFMPSFDSAFKIPDNEITSLKTDHKGQLWLGTKTSGVHLFEPDGQRFRSISGERDLQQQFDRKSINDIFADNQGSLWFATEQGMILVSKGALDIQYLTNSTATLAISDITPLQSGKVAFAGNYQYYDFDMARHAASSQFVDEHRLYRITNDNKNNLWFSTLGQGLQLYSQTNQHFEQIEHAKPLLSQVPVKGLFDAYVDNRNQMWLLPFPDLPHLEGGIIKFDPQSRSYQSYLSAPFVSDIVQIAEDQLLLSTSSGGLITLNTNSKAETHWLETIPSTPRQIFALFKDSSDTLWLGTRGQGLARFDQQNNKFKFFDRKSGLLSDDVYSIVEDKSHNLWLGTDAGLSRFDPISRQFVNIEEHDGLLFSAFYKRSAAMANNGQLLMGTHNGLVSLNPNDFAQNSVAAPVLISDFKVFNKSVDWQKGGEDSPLKQPVMFTDELVLNHQQYMFSFAFSALEFVRPDKIRFAYKMEGLDNQWVETNADNRLAMYTTLPARDYVFKVKATNRHGQWSDKVTSIKVTVLPPWWLSWQAYIAYMLICLASVYFFIIFRTQKLVRRAEVLEQNVNLRTRELQTSRDQVSDLLAQKQQLFASVSHEFRTPLTLILSPIDHLLSDKKGEHITKELGLIKRNGRRLLRMVDQLLEFAKLEMHDNSQKEQISLKQTLEIIVCSFEPLVQSKNIRLTLSPFDDATLNMLPDSLNKILINILSNAFKYSLADSRITVAVTNQTDWVTIAISDTGVGISESDVEAVFQRFNRATHGHSEAVPGAGIGLALVKELVEANEGKITLASVVGEGSTFTVILPVVSTENILPGTSNNASQEVILEHLDLEIDSVKTTASSEANNSNILLDNQQKSILIVDDNPDLRNLLYQQLGVQYQCLLAENGQVGLDLAREQLPDLVISDVMMPVMDGYQLTESLKGDELTSHIPMILLTAKGSMESRLKGLQLLVDDYLAKPFNIEELTLRVHNILTIRDIVKQRFKQVIDEVNPAPRLEALNASKTEQTFINKVNEQLAKHFGDLDFNAKILSKSLAVSERQLQRKLKAQFDLGFPELLRNYRLNKAIEMLQSGERVSQIYHDVGFASHSYFSSCFKAKFSKTPKAYQQSLE